MAKWILSDKSYRLTGIDGKTIATLNVRCSECGFYGVSTFKYCPECGVSMTRKRCPYLNEYDRCMCTHDINPAECGGDTSKCKFKHVRKAKNANDINR